MGNKRHMRTNVNGNKQMSLGKIIFYIGIAGIFISLVLLIIGTYEIDNLVLGRLSVVGLIGIPVSFILAVAGAISWYLEPFVARIRARNCKAGGSQSDYNKHV